MSRLSLGEKFGVAGALGVFTFIILAVIGWIMNIVKIFSLIGCELGAEIVIRVVFVFAFPLGAVAGWFPIQSVC